MIPTVQQCGTKQSPVCCDHPLKLVEAGLADPQL